MPAILKWKQVNEQLPVADINTVPVPLDKVVWHEFSIPDTMTRAQLVCLFTRPDAADKGRGILVPSLRRYAYLPRIDLRTDCQDTRNAAQGHSPAVRRGEILLCAEGS